jgi:hypothetical protein
MPVHTNLNAARMAFHQLRLKKTGKNTYAGYTYFELADFLPAALQIFADHNLCATISFYETNCEMRIVDTTDGSLIIIQSPLADAQTKGSLPIQALGSQHTYMRRYLWLLALEAIESDGIEATNGKPSKANEEYISLAQMNELYKLIDEVGASVDSMCDYYNVKDLHEFPVAKFESAKAVLQKRIKK